jgi:hypothetical protein
MPSQTVTNTATLRTWNLTITSTSSHLNVDKHQLTAVNLRYCSITDIFQEYCTHHFRKQRANCSVSTRVSQDCNTRIPTEFPLVQFSFCQGFVLHDSSDNGAVQTFCFPCKLDCVIWWNQFFWATYLPNYTGHYNMENSNLLRYCGWTHECIITMQHSFLKGCNSRKHD